MNFDDFDDGGQEFKAEAQAWSRVSGGGKLAELLSSINVLDPERRRKDMTPEDRVLIAIDALCRKLSGENFLKLTEADITTILEKTTSITGVRYKNPLAFILGFTASKGGSEITKADFKRATDVLKKLGSDGEGVAPEDVLRYARLWTG